MVEAQTVKELESEITKNLNGELSYLGPSVNYLVDFVNKLSSCLTQVMNMHIIFMASKYNFSHKHVQYCTMKHLHTPNKECCEVKVNVTSPGFNEIISEFL